MTPLRRVGVVVGAVLAAVLTLAAPAAAHGADAPDGTDYRVQAIGLSPARAGLTVRAVEAGARLELVNTTGRDVQVIGYSGEPYLRVGPDGAYENSRSPATYLNRTLAGDTTLPAEADPAAPPRWRKIGDAPRVRWHDQRTQWREAGVPAPAVTEPTRPHRVRDWVVPIRDGAEQVEIRGILDWVPPPDPYPWWVAATLGFLLVGAAGLLPAGSVAGGRALRAVGALLALGGAAAITLVVGRELDAGADGAGPLLLGLLTGQVWALLTGLGAVAAGGWALARRPAADFVLALAGSCLAVFVGVANLATFSRAVAPAPWPGQYARLLLVLVLIAGAGAVGAGVLRLHAASRAAVTAAGHRTPVPA
ncbi:hypothetical protein [Micromonospora sp. KC721]|uniref:hypothetical protein n=1 Tax=Micromonospora sp. KC721 TaxID=2530380 RepID=UPI0010456A70|nr:hypothetical protein [Micromonospora sp. KC721]TDB74377.1 hypothetical protein E1182_19335 [Micromonospora sp. KC721]